jgi:hypothetical protein
LNSRVFYSPNYFDYKIHTGGLSPSALLNNKRIALWILFNNKLNFLHISYPGKITLRMLESSTF